MKRILYCMHVGWNWIKQRPHFIAEELSAYYDITVISDHSYRVKSVDNKSSETDTLHIKEFYKIPMLDHSHGLMKINNCLRKLFYYRQIKMVLPDYIYVMKPNAIRFLPKELGATKLIYDCMDDMVAFAETEGLKKEVLETEGNLIRRADLVLVSSMNLMKVLVERYCITNSSKLCLVRNGYNGEMYDFTTEKKCNNHVFTFCYFGTIASWFNFDYFLNAFQEIDGFKLLLIGPLQAGTTVPNHPNIKYVGSVPHEDLIKYIKDVDAFTMPFIVDDLIRSVDPVKLYEYINFNKNILCVRYDEIERFEKFVYFYSDYKSFKNQVLDIMKNRDTNYSKQDRVEFLRDNTWKNRAEIIRKKLEII